MTGPSPAAYFANFKTMLDLDLMLGIVFLPIFYSYRSLNKYFQDGNNLIFFLNCLFRFTGS